MIDILIFRRITPQFGILGGDRPKAFILKSALNVLAFLVIGIFTSGLVSCMALVPTPAPTITPTQTTTITPTTTPNPTITLTPSPIVTNTPTVQELLDARDETTRVMLHKPVSEVIDFFLEIQGSVRT